MKIVHVGPVKSVTGPLGHELTRENLPPQCTSRWVARRKAEVVTAVEGGLLTVSEACSRYSLTLEELASWQRCYGRGGLKGLYLANVADARHMEDADRKHAKHPRHAKRARAPGPSL